MLGDNAGINDLNQLNILPSSHGSGDLKSPSETAPSKRIPKPRNVFTLSSTAPLLSQENVAKLEQINNAAKQYNIGGNHDQDKSNHVDEGEVVVVVQELDSASSDDSSATSSRTTKLNKNNAHHSSMENLFKPKNHRSSWSGNMSGNTSGGGNARRKRSNCSRSDSDREMVERLTEENMMLIADVEKIRRKKLLFKIAGYFSLAAFRSQRLALEEVRVVKDAKTMGAAARMILHNLLLNSWRNNNKELKSVLEDNAQLNKTVRIYAF
ncbi:uncharacterized protein LOC118439417 [Folsomia candida]|uniref:uncharacterized protein LOC118439417 n=1 Tax=Folsomia candida TaxID=158441 RepID=UPI0016055311|nr:uncharacterized protein LOC118439417 [Folsomia candida]